MTEAMLNRILAEAGAKAGKDEVRELSEGSRLTLYVAHAGASLTIGRVSSLKIDGDVIVAKNDKGERFFLQLGDVFAAGVDATAAQSSARKAGFF